MDDVGDKRNRDSDLPGGSDTEVEEWDWVEYNNNETGWIVPAKPGCTVKSVITALVVGILVYFLTTACLRALMG